MYIPLIKNRQFEMKATLEAAECFSDELIPLFEILNEKFQKRYKKDPDTDEFILELKPNNIKRTRVLLPNLEEDIITLSYIDKIIKGKKAFIDYFRFSVDEYNSTKIDLNAVKLSIDLSRNTESYKSKLVSIKKFSNFIPVISLKKDFAMSVTELCELIKLLKSEQKSIAVRIEAALLERYKDTLKDLTGEDYIMLDIREESADSQIIKYMTLNSLETEAKKVLLNSPRKVNIANPQYEENGVTRFIDNSAVEKYKDWGFVGVGDFGGLKDKLPEKDGGFGKGSAISPLYFRSSNDFWCVRNPDTSLGPRGYAEVKKKILDNDEFFNPEGDCLAIKGISNIENNGAFGTWNYITLLRYIHQMYKNSGD